MYADVLILDGNNLAHRVRNRMSLDHMGQDTTVVYGVLNSLAHLRNKFSAKCIIIIWDGGIPELRYELQPGYKKRNRDDDPEWVAVREQMDDLHNRLNEFGVLSLRLNGSEADDLIYQASVIFRDPTKVCVVSTDDDLLQCVQSNVDFYSPVKDEHVTWKTFHKYTGGIPKKHYVVYKALIGDSSDKIKGVPGIGPALAKSLIDTYGADPAVWFQAALADDPKMPARVRTSLKACGISEYIKVVMTIRLSKDITQCSGYVFDQMINGWTGPAHTSAIKWLRSMNMVSLATNPNLGAMIRGLSNPRDLIPRSLYEG